MSHSFQFTNIHHLEQTGLLAQFANLSPRSLTSYTTPRPQQTLSVVYEEAGRVTCHKEFHFGRTQNNPNAPL